LASSFFFFFSQIFNLLF